MTHRNARRRHVWARRVWSCLGVVTLGLALAGCESNTPNALYYGLNFTPGSVHTRGLDRLPRLYDMEKGFTSNAPSSGRFVRDREIDRQLQRIAIDTRAELEPENH